MAYEVALPDGFVVSDDIARFDLDEVYRFISQDSYWGRGRSREMFDRAVRYSLVMGVFAPPDGRQIGFARVSGDRAMRAHLADVYVLEAYRGRGLGRALVGAVLDHPELSTVGTWTLVTRDAHGLYAGFGFTGFTDSARQMIRVSAAPDPKTA
jgi:GNAT superfamily N-acetyltransferase